MLVSADRNRDGDLNIIAYVMYNGHYQSSFFFWNETDSQEVQSSSRASWRVKINLLGNGIMSVS